MFWFSTKLKDFAILKNNLSKDILGKGGIAVTKNTKSVISPLQKHVRKVVGGFGKKSCVSTGLRKPGNTYASPTAIV